MHHKAFDLLVMVLLAVAVFGCNKKEGPDPQQTVNESFAISELMGIRAQIQTYMQDHHEYPETLEALRLSLGAADSALPEVHSFRYKYAKTESGWECYAVPLNDEKGTRSFYTSEGDTIRSKQGICDTDGKNWETVVQRY